MRRMLSRLRQDLKPRSPDSSLHLVSDVAIHSRRSIRASLRKHRPEHASTRYVRPSSNFHVLCRDDAKNFQVPIIVCFNDCSSHRVKRRARNRPNRLVRNLLKEQKQNIKIPAR